MAVVTKIGAEELYDPGDITHKLPTLQFESALSDEEKELLHFRKRSHAITVSACAQATYFASILNEARQVKLQLRFPELRRATRLLQEGAPKDPLRVGIIGCGRLGCHIAHCLLTFGEIKPEDISISTRRPETLTELQEKGVRCVYNNVEVASSVHLLFLCVLPSQLPGVAEDVVGEIAAGSIVYSFIASVRLPRLKQLLRTNNIIRPKYSYRKAVSDQPWNTTLEVTEVFAVDDMLQMTCPLNPHSQEAVVSTDEKFAEQLLYAFVNMCTEMELTRAETISVVNAVMLGHSSNSPLQQKLKETDITRYKQRNDLFPMFDLCTIPGRDTPVTALLLGNGTVRNAFVTNYCGVFQHYREWKNRSLQEIKKQTRFSLD